MHRGGPGVSVRFTHRARPFICTQINGILLESCAESSLNFAQIDQDPAGSHAPVVAHTKVLWSKPGRSRTAVEARRACPQ
jgi:hypothetical protein